MVELAKDALSNDFSDQLKNMRIPTLVVSGDKDESVPFETSRRLADNILPNGKFVLMKGENHYVGVINPEKLCKHIIKFFN